MDANSEHNLDRYRGGCRCPSCKQANRDYMRAYRAERRGLGGPPPQPDSPDTRASVTVLPTPVVVVDAEPGPIEQSVRDEVRSLSAAERRPSSVQTAIGLARDLDNRRLATCHASLARQLEATMKALRDASMPRRGRLAAVAQMSHRRSSRDAV